MYLFCSTKKLGLCKLKFGYLYFLFANFNNVYLPYTYGHRGKYQTGDVSTSPTAGTACAKSEGFIFHNARRDN